MRKGRIPLAEHYPFQKQPLPYGCAALAPQCSPDALYVHYTMLYLSLIHI